jgi:hypothetical protein
MSRGLNLLETAISILGWMCGLIALTTPAWFAVAAFGTKWAFWSWEFGLEFMILTLGPNLILACLVAAGLTAILIALHRVIAGEFFGVITAPVLALVVGLTGGAWSVVAYQEASEIISIADVTTDFDDPPHFTAGFTARRGSGDQGLEYAGKTGESGRALSEIQSDAYPGLETLYLEQPSDEVFQRAMILARDAGWRIGTASRSAGMFEAGAESFWFGFRDDMVVRVRVGEGGGSIVDVRSIARLSIDERGRNARRVQLFLEMMAADQTV